MEATPVTGLLQRARALGLMGLVLAAGACSPSGEPPAAAVPTTPRTGGAAVAIRLVAFNPAPIDIAAGTTVTWTQTDKGSFHTVTSGTVQIDPTGAATTASDGGFDSGRLPQDTTFSHTFPEPGAYPYFCVIHPATMRGEVTVR
jgi:plastocyanin